MKKIVIAYVPVLHAGYGAFFDELKEADEWYVFGTDIISEFDYLRKEIRALDPSFVAKALSALFNRDVFILDKESLEKLSSEDVEISAPLEDVTKELVEKYFNTHKVTWRKIFLRWNRENAIRENEIAPDREIEVSNFEKELFAKVYEEADKVSDWWLQVGALITRDGEPLLWGGGRYGASSHKVWSEGDPRNCFWRGVNAELTTSLHAERGLIAEAAKQGISLEGTSLYISHFPCPMCSKMIAAAGISQVFYAEGYSILDGASALRDGGVEIIKVNGVDVPERGEEFLPYPENKKTKE